MSEITLIEKIEQDAATAVAEINAAGESVVKDIQRETQAEIDGLNEVHSVQLKKQKEHLELVAVSRAKQAGNIAVQQIKRDQIEALFIELEEELVNQSPEEYVSFFQKQAETLVDKGVKVVSVQAPENRQSETAKVLAALGLTGEVVVGASIRAGFIVFAEEGVFDVTLDRLIKERRAELEMVIIKKVMA